MSLYDVFQNFRMDGIRKNVDSTDIKSSGNRSSISELQDQVDHLSLVCQAMCELMAEIGFNKDMMVAKIQEIDLRDGKLDGKLSKTHNCDKCERALSPRHLKCMYCGTAISKADLL